MEQRHRRHVRARVPTGNYLKDDLGANLILVVEAAHDESPASVLTKP
jgi:hypothetical protein